MNAVAKVEENNAVPAIPSAPITMLDIINRAAFDPEVSADKVERLLEMAMKVKAQDAKAAYTRGLVAMKPDLPVIDRKGRIEVRKKTASGERDGEVQQSTSFARWEDIDEKITPILSKHGFALTFRTGNQTDGRVTVTGVLSHQDGHSEESTMALPLDTTGSKNNVQAAGSSTSYGKRYTATALLNIRTKGEDDDGKAGGDPGTISAADLATLQDLIDRSHSDIEKFCKYMGVEALAELTERDLPRAREALNEALSAWQRKHPKAAS
jgi:hypothetical protein